MYKAQQKLNLDTLLGGILVLGGVAWTVMTMAFLPAPAAKALASAAPQSQLISAAPNQRSTEEVTSFPSDQLQIMIDKKYA